MIELHKVRTRAALQPHREPYWGAPLSQRGRVLGFRKIDANTGSWIARMRDEHNVKVTKALGLDAPAFGYEEACKAAHIWFNGRDGGINGEDITVEGACREYVEDRREKKSEQCARDARLRFERHMYGTPLRSIKLVKLRTPASSNGGAKAGSASQPPTAPMPRSQWP